MSVTHLVEQFESSHDSAALAIVMRRVFGWKGWADARQHFIDGPPEFMREGWVSPLLNERFNLEILDRPNVIQWIKGDQTGWRESKLVLIEFWASCVFLSSISCAYLLSFAHLSDGARYGPCCLSGCNR